MSYEILVMFIRFYLYIYICFMRFYSHLIKFSFFSRFMHWFLVGTDKMVSCSFFFLVEDAFMLDLLQALGFIGFLGPTGKPLP